MSVGVASSATRVASVDEHILNRRAHPIKRQRGNRMSGLVSSPSSRLHAFRNVQQLLA
jgi:hypothetical protein